MRMRMLVLGVAAVLVGCSAPPVRWDEPQSAPGDSLGALAVSAAGAVEFVRVPVAPTEPTDSTMCAGSLVMAAEGGQWYAAWMRRRPDSTVAVVASRAVAGQPWSTAGIVDSVDAGKFGCARPFPSIAVAGGYVHIAYSLKAPEGYGVFFAHSMDQTATFHAPMIVVYGDRLSETATAADGMRVAVAYDDPSGNGERVDVAVSTTQGHTFERRAHGSPDEMRARAPRIAIRDTVVALSFGSDGGRAVRTGRMRR